MDKAANNNFLHKSIMKGGLPFEMKQPHFNSVTEIAMQETRDILDGKISTKSYSSASELFKELDLMD